MCPSILDESNPIFNKKKVFLYDEPQEINLDSLPQLSENWLSELEGLLQQENSLGRHITTYPGLKDSLKMIYHRLNNNLDHLLGSLTDSGRQEIIEKLREDIGQCSEGFYNRVNQIIQSFQRPQNLSQLLYQVRQGIVKEKVAINLTTEVHSWNFVSKIAMQQGLGVKANYAEDRYREDLQSGLSDEKIKDALRNEFETFFTPYYLPYLLAEQLRGLLARDGYDGLKEGDGYVLGDIEKITETIKAYLSESYQEREGYDFFIVDEQSDALVDLNWHKIREYLFDSLVENHYFVTRPTQEEIFNLFDYACFIDLYPSNAELKVNPNFFEKNTLYSELQRIKVEFPFFWKKLHSNSVLMSDLLQFINYLNKERVVEKSDLKKLKILLSLNFNFMTKNKDFFLNFFMSFMNKTNVNMLMYSARYQPEALESLFVLLSKDSKLIDEETFRERLLHRDRFGFNVLMLLAVYQRERLIHLVMLLSQCSKLIDQKMFSKMVLQQNQDGLSFFMLVIQSHPEKLELLLNYLFPDSKQIPQDMFRDLFLQKDKNGYSVLMKVINSFPKRKEKIEYLLIFLLKYCTCFDSETFKKMLLQKNQDGLRFFTLADSSHPEKLELLLKHCSYNSKQIQEEVRREENNEKFVEMFLKQDDRGFNPLMIVTCFKPEDLERLLSILSTYSVLIDEKLLKNFFLQKNKDGRNILKLAFERQSKGLELLLNFLLNPSYPFDEYFFKELFLQEDKESWISLMLQELNKPKIGEKLLKLLLKSYGLFDEETLESILSTYHQDSDSSLSVAQELITAYLKEIDNVRGQNIVYRDSCFSTDVFTQQKRDAASLLQSLLSGKDIKSGIDNLSNDYPALNNGQLGKIFNFVCQTLERETPVKVDAPRRHGI